ncbi:hypothetical protein L9F63_025582, partial [Diploptera punctata]
WAISAGKHATVPFAERRSKSSSPCDLPTPRALTSSVMPFSPETENTRARQP